MSLFDDLKPLLESYYRDPNADIWDRALANDLENARKSLEMLAFTWFCKFGRDDVEPMLEYLEKLEELENV